MKRLLQNSYLSFTVFSFALVAPLNGLLSRAGMSICPIMQGHGFWFGCSISAKFVFSLLLCSLVTGNIAIFAHKKGLLHSRFADKSVALGAIVLPLNLGLAFIFRLYYWDSISDAGSPYGEPISLILLVAGIAIAFFQASLLDYLLLRQAGHANVHALEFKPVKIRDAITEIWSSILYEFAPISVLSAYFYFTFVVYQSQAEGWGSLADQTPKIIIATILVFAWYLTNITFLSLGRRVNIDKLVDQAKNLRNLQVDRRIDLSRLGNLSLVGEGLNSSAEVITQRTRLISGFSKFVSDRLIETIVKSDSVELLGQQVESAILMADLRDFTKLSATMAPVDVVRMLNIYFEDMITVLYRHNVQIDKFIGDGLLAYVPANPQCTTRNACSELLAAAAEMILKLRETNQRLKSEGLPELKIGIGLHFGPVILGAIGSKSRMQYTIIGDSVNRAARIESLCRELQSSLVVSNEFMNLVPETSMAEFQGPQQCLIKGIEESIQIYNFNGDLDSLSLGLKAA